MYFSLLIKETINTHTICKYFGSPSILFNSIINQLLGAHGSKRDGDARNEGWETQKEHMLKNRIYFCSKSFAESISDYLQNFPVVFLYFKLLDFSKDLTDKNCYMSGERGRKRSSDKKMPSKLGISACLVRNNDDLVEDEVEEEVIPDPMVEKGSKLKPNKNGASEKPKCVWYDPDDDQL